MMNVYVVLSCIDREDSTYVVGVATGLLDALMIGESVIEDYHNPDEWETDYDGSPVLYLEYGRYVRIESHLIGQ